MLSPQNAAFPLRCPESGAAFAHRRSAGPGYASGVDSSASPHEAAQADDDALHAAAAMYDLVSLFVRLTPRDLTLTSLSTLVTLSRKGPRRITELAASEGVAQPSVTSLVTSLERAGLVERRSDPADRRVVMVTITEAGTAYLRSRRQANAQAIVRAIEELPPEEMATLVNAVPVIEHLRALLEERGSADRTASSDRQAREANALSV
jgi:DNA-binding MarR family transcriptional regulator